MRKEVRIKLSYYIKTVKSSNRPYHVIRVLGREETDILAFSERAVAEQYIAGMPTEDVPLDLLPGDSDYRPVKKERK